MAILETEWSLRRQNVTNRFARNPYYARSAHLFKFPEGNGQKYMLNGNLGGFKGACGARM